MSTTIAFRRVRAAAGPALCGIALACAATPAVAADGGMEAGDPAKVSAPVVAPLKPGSRGPRVRALQRALGVRADGVYGRSTKRAVVRFQKRRGLKADGIAGARTLRLLGIAVAATTRPIPRDVRVVLERIAECESGGDPTAVSPNGLYRGKYQFAKDTWRALGGRGHANRASEAEQDRRAADLYAREGVSPWPTCGPQAVR